MRYISFRFSPDRISPLLFDRSFFASWGRIPRFTNVEVRDNLLILRPDVSGTGTVHIPMEHPRFGIMLQSSETLRQREKPYNLLKELGRGKLGRLMRSLYEWNINGFIVGKEDHDKILHTLHDFGTMATSDEADDATDQAAYELLQRLDGIVLEMVQKYFDQMFVFQKQRFKRHPNYYVPLEIGLLRTTEFIRNQDDIAKLQLNVNDNSEIEPPKKDRQANPVTINNAATEKDATSTKNADVSEYLHNLSLEDTTNIFVTSEDYDAFEYVAAIPCWKEIEPQQGQFCFDSLEEQIREIEQSGRKVIIGPVLTFDPAMLPRWVHTRIDQREFFENAALNMAIQLANHFSRRCSRWLVSSRTFSAPKCGFSVGRGVSLICDMIEEIKRAVSGGLVLVGLDQPFGDFYSSYNCPLPFIAIIESLASVASLDGFVLELHLGMNHNNTLLRDPIAFSRVFDVWGLWRKRLYISLSVSNDWNFFPQPWTPERIEQVQSEWISLIIQICLLKRNVRGLFWDSVSELTPIFENLIEPLNAVPSRVR